MNPALNSFLKQRFGRTVISKRFSFNGGDLENHINGGDLENHYFIVCLALNKYFEAGTIITR